MPPHTTPPTAHRWRIYDQINNKWSDRVFSLDELKAMPNPSSTYIIPADSNSDDQTPTKISDLFSDILPKKTKPGYQHSDEVSISDMSKDDREFRMLSDLRMLRNTMVSIVVMIVLTDILAAAAICLYTSSITGVLITLLIASIAIPALFFWITSNNLRPPRL